MTLILIQIFSNLKHSTTANKAPKNSCFLADHFAEVYFGASLAACQKSEDIGGGSLVVAARAAF